MRRFSYRLVQYFVLFLVTSDIGHSLPDGFIKDLVAYIPPSVLKDTVITAATVAPYPQSLNKNLSTSPSSALVFLASKDGKIIVVDIPNSKLAFPPSSNFTMMLDWEPRVCHDGTRWGIHSMTVHPKFATTHPYLYIMYSSRNADNVCWDKTLRSAAVNHVSRATVNFRPRKLTSELTLLELSSTQQSFISSKTPQEGTLSFGKDGMLYVATTSYDANSTLDRTPFLQGTILRIHDDGRIPRDNPNVSPLRAAPPCGKKIPSKPSKNCPEIFATGLHRPVELAMDPDSKDTTVQFRVLDRGTSMWEEIHMGGTDMPLANYGWPSREGPCERGSDKKCFAGNKQRSSFDNPSYFYHHYRQENGEDDEAEPHTGEISSGVFVPQKAKWPSKYRFLFYDKVAGKLFHLVQSSNGNCPTCVPPVPGYRNETFSTSFPSLIDMTFQLNQELYLTTCDYSKGCQVWQARYTGIVDKLSKPIAKIEIKNFAGDENEDITFDSVGGFKSYYWDFGDGSKFVTTQSSVHAYKKKGMYLVTLIVKDQDGVVTQDFLTLDVGSSTRISIISPSWGGRFEVGQSLQLIGSSEDSEEVPDSRMFWDVRQIRIGENFYRTLFERTAGNKLKTLPAPGPEDLEAVKDSYLEVTMTAMNNGGVISAEAVAIYPTLSDVLFTSSPPGLEILVDDFLIVTPKLITTWKNHTLRLEARDQPPFYFQSWSDGGPRSRTYFVSNAAMIGRPNPTISVTFKDKSIPLKSKTRDCSKSKQCSLCEGHCQSDSECKDDMVCFRKGGKGHVVPGCIGMDKSNTDWCTYPNATRTVSLVPKTRECSESQPCGRCEGHCQSKKECQGSLVCFQDGGSGKYVPGCSGFDESKTAWCTIAASIN